MIWPCSPPCNAGAFGGLEPRRPSPGSTSTALSQVSCVIGFGSSCSQPLLAKRPSRIDGSWRKAISSRPVRRRPADCGLRDAADVDATAAARTRCSAMTPSCSQRRQRAIERRRAASAATRLDRPSPADRPVLADDVVAGSLGPVAQRGEHLVRRLAAVERRDQRLDDRDRAVVARARRSTLRGSAPRESASGTAPTSRRRRD